jgi:hypothetical protein
VLYRSAASSATSEISLAVGGYCDCVSRGGEFGKRAALLLDSRAAQEFRAVLIDGIAVMVGFWHTMRPM